MKEEDETARADESYLSAAGLASASFRVSIDPVTMQLQL